MDGPASPAGTPRVAVVVPVYNRAAITRDFLEDFSRVTYPDHEVVVVDDASPDGSADMIAREFPRVHLIRGTGNFWWSRAMNTGVRDALARGARYILSINDDVRVDPGFLGHLVAYAEAHPRTLTGSVVYMLDSPETVWYAGGTISWLRGELRHRTELQEAEPEWLTGMGTLIPSEAFREVGLYDEMHFPQYVADADLSMRARRAGFRLAVVPESRIWNRAEESTQKTLRRHVTLRTFFLPLTSLRSDAQWRARTALYRRYWPAALAPIACTLYYARFFSKQTVRLLKLRG